MSDNAAAHASIMSGSDSFLSWNTPINMDKIPEAANTIIEFIS
jgi:hypothetical protein